jgi:hypothetical protein
MNANDREQVRLSLLRYLDANAGKRFPLSEPLLRRYLQGDGFDCSEIEVRAELNYLFDKRLAKPSEKQISPENITWVITSDGRDEYAKR